jgi:hypothetical protein
MCEETLIEVIEDLLEMMRNGGEMAGKVSQRGIQEILYTFEAWITSRMRHGEIKAHGSTFPLSSESLFAIVHDRPKAEGPLAHILFHYWPMLFCWTVSVDHAHSRAKGLSRQGTGANHENEENVFRKILNIVTMVIQLSLQ